MLAAVGVLHDRHAAAFEVEQLVAGLLERGQRQPRGTGVEVDDSHGGGPLEVAGAKRRQRPTESSG